MPGSRLNGWSLVFNAGIIMEPKRILIARTDRIGDVVLSTPVIRQLRKNYPDAYISFMVQSGNRDLVANNPDLDEVITLDRRGSEKGFRGIFRFSRMIRRKKFDTAIALHPTNRVHLLFFLAGIPVRIGYDRKMAFLLTRKIRHDKHLFGEHESVSTLKLMRDAGFAVDIEDISPYVESSAKDRDSVDSVFRDLGISESPVAVHPGASCPSKRWDPDGFAEVSEVLRKKYGKDIVLIGGDETMEISRSIASSSKEKLIDLTGALRLGELAEFLSRCCVLVSNDSGPVHVAAAVNTPCVVIFGRSDPGLSPDRWGPAGVHNRLIHKDVGCEKCSAHECKIGFACLRAVSSRDVLDAVSAIIGEPA
ncbi:MAG: lipopolysaccharide heptosyltransferase II [Candidatus Omnitrophica bacterium]|nr:lipopolysaccharide heptosyltransferase II [Candidatus Omnitrophota bacterium]